jgi:H+/Cl- antiporter ClcA
MWGQRPGFHVSGIVGYAIAALAFAAYLGLRWLTHRIAPPNPRWIQAILLLIIICFIFFPKALGDALGWLVDKSLFWLHPEKDDQ